MLRHGLQYDERVSEFLLSRIFANFLKFAFLSSFDNYDRFRIFLFFGTNESFEGLMMVYC